MMNKPGLDFSFSGLKTHALTVWNASKKDDRAQRAIAHAFQEAVVTTLVSKCQRALMQNELTTLVVAGGVGANQALRAALQGMVSGINAEVFFPRHQFCTDNGAMVAYAGCLHALQGAKDADLGIIVKARWPLSS
jgi:N6-L-threonylcarbamoyladenine synthase